jgi:[acyl-carrier-protein] S-malonyltransferase
MPSSLAFVFPGQGSQSVGMLSALAQAYPEVEQTFTEASDRVGFHLWDLVRSGPKERLDRTENTQPALLTASVAVWRVWKARGGTQPAYLAGHSLGEYSALVCAGVLSLGDAADLVAQRGQLMQEAVPEGVGAMAAVLGGEDETVIEVCREAAGDEVVAPANFNCPGQVVIAGHSGAVDRALKKLGELGVKKSVKLPVSVPSHTNLMREAADRLAERMQALEWHVPQIPVIQNVTAQAAEDATAIREALTRQLYLPVRWSDGMHALAQAGVTRIGECGPGKVLTGLAKRIERSLDARALGTPEAMDQALAAWS